MSIENNTAFLENILSAVESLPEGGGGSVAGKMENITEQVYDIYLGSFALKCSLALLNGTELILHSFPQTGTALDGSGWSGLSVGMNAVGSLTAGTQITLDTVTTENYYGDGTFSGSASVTPKETVGFDGSGFSFGETVCPDYLGQGYAEYIAFTFHFTIA